MQFEVLPANSTYNVTLNGPDPVPGNGTEKRVKRSAEVKRTLSRQGAFHPSGGRKKMGMGRRMGVMPWPRS